MTSEEVVTEDAWAMVETAARLLEYPGMVVVPGAYKRWIVVGTLQAQTLGYMAFLTAV